MKACIQCRYCKREGDTAHDWACKKFGRDIQLSDALSLVVGRRTHSCTCIEARNNESKCGANASGFRRRWF